LGTSTPQSATTTTSCTYNTTTYGTTGCTTSNPTLTLSRATTTSVLVIVTARVAPGAANVSGFASFAVSGTSTVAATDSTAVIETAASNGDQVQASTVSTLTITAGASNRSRCNTR
jgi:hypothetical protein